MNRDFRQPSIGIDIIKISRIEYMIRKYGKRFLDRIFSTSEQTYCSSKFMPFNSFAARWAAKEALIKAIGKGNYSYKDIEIYVDKDGAPFFNFNSDSLIVKVKGKNISLSVSHDGDYAIANVFVS